MILNERVCVRDRKPRMEIEPMLSYLTVVVVVKSKYGDCINAIRLSELEIKITTYSSGSAL